MNLLISKFRAGFITCIIGLFISNLNAQQNLLDTGLFQPKPSATIYSLAYPVTIDGNLDDSGWQRIPWIEQFGDITYGFKKNAPETKLKLAWDNQNLYIAAMLATPHVWANISQNDVAIFMDDALEIFIDPDGDTHNYAELEINANNNVMDLFMTKPYRDRGTGLLDWELKDWQHKISINGTLNNGTDIDKNWTVEMALPLKAFRFGNTAMPSDKTIWRMNFFRVVWDVVYKDGKYTKAIDPVTKINSLPHHWTWSAQGLNSIHYPERWGYVQFSKNNSPVSGEKIFSYQEDKGFNYLWLIYYNQKAYFQRNKKYAQSVADIFTNNSSPVLLPKEYSILLEATTRQFTASISNPLTGIIVQIDQDGKIVQLKNQ